MGERRSIFILNISKESYLWCNSWLCNSFSPRCLLYIFCRFPLVSDWCMFSCVSSGQRHRSYCTQSSWTIRWNHHRYLGSGGLDLGRNIIWQNTPWMLRLNWSRLGESPLIDLWNRSIYSSRYAKQKLWEGTLGPSHSRSKSSSPLSRLGPLQDSLFRTLIHDSHFRDNCLRLRKIWSFHVVVSQRTSIKCFKMENPRAWRGHFTLLFHEMENARAWRALRAKIIVFVR